MAFTLEEWAVIYNKLFERYADRPSFILVRSKMRRELGFTTRRHRAWDEEFGYVENICVDFYSDEAETLFRLTYI